MLFPPEQAIRCYTSYDIAPLRGTVGHHRAYKIDRVGYMGCDVEIRLYIKWVLYDVLRYIFFYIFYFFVCHYSREIEKEKMKEVMK